MSGGGSDIPEHTTSTVTQSNEPPSYVAPYASNLLSGASTVASVGYQPYPGVTLAPLSPEHQAALYYGTQLATQGQPTQNAANAQAQATLYGAGFDNPYLSDAIQLAQERVLPGAGYLSRESGSYGNSGINEAVAQQMGDIATQMSYQNYGDERNRQMQALGYAPELAGLDTQNVQMLMGLGDISRNYQQQLLDSAAGQWDTAINWPYSQYDWFANILRGSAFGTGTSDSTTTADNPMQQSSLANLIGGGMAAAGLASALKDLF